MKKQKQWKVIKRIMTENPANLLQDPEKCLKVIEFGGYVKHEGNVRLHFNIGLLNLRRNISQVCFDMLEQFPEIQQPREGFLCLNGEELQINTQLFWSEGLK